MPIYLGPRSLREWYMESDICGIAGAWWPNGLAQPEARRAIEAMTDSLVHRGSDARGTWIDSESGLTLGHRRLAIVDRSDAGAQPMVSASGRYVLVFNGEVYNHGALRSRLDANSARGWRGHSDTETLLAAIEAWGLTKALQRSYGMFALALWDREARGLWLARDRIGEKPLYYGVAGPGFAFASELKAFGALPGFSPDVDLASIAAFLRYLYIPEPFSVYNGINKLAPGHIVEVRDGISEAPVPYWTLQGLISGGAETRLSSTRANPVEALENTLSEVVQSQLLGDVPMGSFLSGGIDSSLITAMMQSNSASPVSTFSIGFEDQRFDESAHAAAVAGHLGTKHTEFVVTEADALETVSELPAVYDEPFADCSQIPTLLLSRLARSEITVALTGDGADESFGGYDRYLSDSRVWRAVAGAPRPARRALAAGGRLSGQLLAPENTAVQGLARRLGIPLHRVDRAWRSARLLAASDRNGSLLAGLVGMRSDPATLMRHRAVPHELPILSETMLHQLGRARWMMACDTLSFLPGDILHKVDRAAMSASLETRAPYLDKRVLDAAWRLPDAWCLDGGKRILREILYRYVPRNLVDRPKRGFLIPLDAWLRGGFRDWAESLLSSAALNRVGLLNPRTVRAVWQHHLSGAGNHGYQLWALLMLQAWGERWLPTPRNRPGEALRARPE